MPRQALEDARPTAQERSHRLLDSLRTQLRFHSADIDRLEAENVEQRDIVRNLRRELARLRNTQKTDAQDLVHLASKLLALTRAADGELDPYVKGLFRRRGWSSTTRRGQQP